MRKVVYGINLTADGCCEHTKFNGTEEIQEYFTALMDDVDLIIYGRKTYELMVPYWPDFAKEKSGSAAAHNFARKFNAIDKVVFSRSLEKVDGNTKLIRSDLKEEVLKLKNDAGRNISIGGVDLPSQLIALGLVDEFYLVIHPIIGIQGRRLFDEVSLDELLKLTLVDTTVLQSGCTVLHYLK